MYAYWRPPTPTTGMRVRPTAAFARERRPLPDYLIPLGRTVGLPMNGAVSNLAVNPTSVGALSRELRHGGYDVVHVHEPNAPAVSWFAAEHASAPLVGTFHTYSTAGLTNRFAASVAGARRLYSKLSARIAVSEAARWTAQRFYGGEYRVIPNGVDLRSARPAHDHTDGELRLLFVGRAEERKGLPVLLRAFEALRAAGVPARLKVAGATEDEVQPLLLDPEGVEVAGRVSDEEKWRLLGEADLLVAPSLGGESFGMVLTEAFASATPVVCSDIAGYRDVVKDGSDGVLVPPGDPVELGEALRSLALDPQRRARMSDAAVQSAERFAWPRVASEVVETYEQAVEMPAPEGRPARAAARMGMRPASPGPRRPPRRLPSLEPREHGARRKAFRTRAAGCGRRCRGRRHRPDAPCASAAGHRLGRALARRRHRGLGARGLRASCACRCCCAPRPGTRFCAPPCRTPACAAATRRAAR